MLTATQPGATVRAARGQRAECPACGGEVVAARVGALRGVWRWSHVSPCTGPRDDWFRRLAVHASLSLAARDGLHAMACVLHDPHGRHAMVIDARTADVATGLSYPGADPPSFLLTPAWGWLASVARKALDDGATPFVALPDRTVFWVQQARQEITTKHEPLGGVLCLHLAGRRIGLAHIMDPDGAPVHPLDTYHTRRTE